METLDFRDGKDYRSVNIRPSSGRMINCKAWWWDKNKQVPFWYQNFYYKFEYYFQ